MFSRRARKFRNHTGFFHIFDNIRRIPDILIRDRFEIEEDHGRLHISYLLTLLPTYTRQSKTRNIFIYQETRQNKEIIQ
jgi:hypothetical protein